MQIQVQWRLLTVTNCTDLQAAVTQAFARSIPSGWILCLPDNGLSVAICAGDVSSALSLQKEFSSTQALLPDGMLAKPSNPKGLVVGGFFLEKLDQAGVLATAKKLVGGVAQTARKTFFPKDYLEVCTTHPETGAVMKFRCCPASSHIEEVLDKGIRLCLLLHTRNRANSFPCACNGRHRRCHYRCVALLLWPCRR